MWINNWVALIDGPSEKFIFNRKKLKPLANGESVTMPTYQLVVGQIYDITVTTKHFVLVTLDGLVELTKSEVHQHTGIVEYLSQSKVILRPGWTVSKVKSLLGEPDKTCKAYGYSKPLRLYALPRIEAVEAAQGESK
jgi:uridine kinase